MTVTADTLLSEMLRAGASAFGEGWTAVSTFARTEFKKIADTLIDIAGNVAAFQSDPTKGYSPEVGRTLLAMQKGSTEAVFVALTALTLITVQQAINAVLDVAKALFAGALDVVL